jgi:hypothetical protein
MCGRHRSGNKTPVTLAGDVALQAQLHRPDAIFVDAGDIGAAVIDRLRQLGVENVHKVWFGGKGGISPRYLAVTGRTRRYG